MSRRLEDLEPATLDLCRQFLERVRSLGIEVKVIQTLRTNEEQALLFAKGRDLPGPKVTDAPPGASWHNHGRAFDVAFVGKYNNILWDGPWETLGDIGEKLGLTWGGRFKHLVDKPHFEFHPGWSIVNGEVKKDGSSNIPAKA